MGKISSFSRTGKSSAGVNGGLVSYKKSLEIL